MKEKFITEIELTDSERRAYDEICISTMVNIYHDSKAAGYVGVYDFNPKDEEHLFILYVAKAFSAFSSTPLYVDTSWFNLWKLNRGLKKDFRFKKLKKGMKGSCRPEKILTFMRDFAKDITQDEDFNYGKIYRAFYC